MRVGAEIARCYLREQTDMVDWACAYGVPSVGARVVCVRVPRLVPRRAACALCAALCAFGRGLGRAIEGLGVFGGDRMRGLRATRQPGFLPCGSAALIDTRSGCRQRVRRVPWLPM